jgi:hypothetical protein
MERSTVMNLLSVIPERSVRRQSGTRFEGREGRPANLARYLSWLSPLNPLSKEDQAAIGYTAVAPRAEDADSDEGADDEALAPAEAEAEPEPVRILQRSGSHF